jgi:hypothetical protein
MSTHPSAEQLSAFLDQELPDAGRLSIEEHLRACDACAAHLAELAAVDEAARALPLEEPAGYFDDFASRVRGRIAARPTRRALPVWAWAAAAAVLLAVVTPLAWRERAAQSPAAAMKAQAAPPAAVPAAPAASPASAASPQAAPAGAQETRMAEAERSLSRTHGGRANEVEPHDRLLRRDQAGEGAPVPEFQASQDKREAPAQPEPTITTPPPARLEEKVLVETKPFGYTPPPPATSQRPHGPSGQQQAPPPAAAPAAAPPPADREAAAATAEVVVGNDQFRDADRAKEKDDDAARQRRGAGGAADGAKLGATSSGSVLKAAPAPAQTGDEARRRRETFRRMALEQPEGPGADDARVGTIAEGVRAYRLEGRADDRVAAERDGRAYLARPDALQATRVRLLLKQLSEPRS